MKGIEVLGLPEFERSNDISCQHLDSLVAGDEHYLKQNIMHEDNLIIYRFHLLKYLKPL